MILLKIPEKMMIQKILIHSPKSAKQIFRYCIQYNQLDLLPLFEKLNDNVLYVIVFNSRSDSNSNNNNNSSNNKNSSNKIWYTKSTSRFGGIWESVEWGKKCGSEILLETFVNKLKSLFLKDNCPIKLREPINYNQAISDKNTNKDDVHVTKSTNQHNRLYLGRILV